MSDHLSRDSHVSTVAHRSAPGDQGTLDNHSAIVVGVRDAQDHPDSQAMSGVPDPWRLLRVTVEIAEAYQKLRVATENRALRAGLPKEAFTDLLEEVHRLELSNGRRLRRAYRKVVPQPIKKWISETHGLGVPAMAKLVGLLGDPLHATPWHWEGKGRGERHLVPDAPYERTLRQLWAYCGLGDHERSRHPGMTVEELQAAGNARLRAVLFVIAEACVKQTSGPYRAVYQNRRSVTIDRVHAKPCTQCGTTGKPAEVGTPWRPGHQHGDALRVVAKEILRDLWRVARGEPIDAATTRDDTAASQYPAMIDESQQAAYGTSGGIELTDALLERLLREAEEGYDPTMLRSSQTVGEHESERDPRVLERPSDGGTPPEDAPATGGD